jgi:hypothetical protein
MRCAYSRSVRRAPCLRGQSASSSGAPALPSTSLRCAHAERCPALFASQVFTVCRFIHLSFSLLITYYSHHATSPYTRIFEFSMSSSLDSPNASAMRSTDARCCIQIGESHTLLSHIATRLWRIIPLRTLIQVFPSKFHAVLP